MSTDANAAEDPDAVLRRWMRRRLQEDGNQYFKTRHVADATGISASRLSYYLPELEDAGVIERWSDSNSPVTWRIAEDLDGGDLQ